jgi:hypothetical protein
VSFRQCGQCSAHLEGRLLKGTPLNWDHKPRELLITSTGCSWKWEELSQERWQLILAGVILLSDPGQVLPSRFGVQSLPIKSGSWTRFPEIIFSTCTEVIVQANSDLSLKATRPNTEKVFGNQLLV